MMGLKETKRDILSDVEKPDRRSRVIGNNTLFYLQTGTADRIKQLISVTKENIEHLSVRDMLYNFTAIGFEFGQMIRDAEKVDFQVSLVISKLYDILRGCLSNEFTKPKALINQGVL